MGGVTKLTNQVIVNITIEAVYEGLVLASKVGADLQSVYEAIRDELAGSMVLDDKMPRIMNGDFKIDIPVCMSEEESKFNSIPYVILSGNLGEIETLREAI